MTTLRSLLVALLLLILPTGQALPSLPAGPIQEAELARSLADQPSSVDRHDSRPGMAQQPYDMLPPAAKSYVLQALALQRQRSSNPLADAVREADDQSPAGSNAPFAQKNLRGLWTVEAHGHPLEVVSASPPGATFLATTRAVLRFESPGAQPSWMAKFGTNVGRIQTADANGDQSLDVVVELAAWSWIWWSRELLSASTDPSVAVLDGKTGAVLFSGIAGVDRLAAWTLTDVDQDGKQDILGVSMVPEVAAYRLDGTKIFGHPFEQSFEDIDLDTLRVLLSYTGPDDIRFGEFNGDGTLDLAISGSLAAGLVVQTGGPIGLETAALMVETRSGRTGDLLWTQPLAEPADFTFGWIAAVGDLDADAKDDVVVEAFSYFDFDPDLPEVYSELGYQSHSIVGFNGANGLRLFEDVRREAGVAVQDVSEDRAVGEVDYEPIEILDLDNDGATEIVHVEVAENGDPVVRGRALPETPGGATTQAYEIPIRMGKHDMGPIRVRDLDGNGKDDLLLMGYSSEENASKTGHSVLHTHLAEVIGGKVDIYTTPELVALYDYDVVGKQGYGWVLGRDVWTPMDHNGAVATEGFRLLVSTSILRSQDVNGDRIPDFLLRKSQGLAWLDGRTGILLEDLRLPENRLPRMVIEENGKLKVVCRDLERNTFLVDPSTGADEWSIERNMLGEDVFLFLTATEDVDGDGDHEVFLMAFGEDAWALVYDPRAKQEIYAGPANEHLRPFDGVPSRRGAEILRSRGGEEGYIALSIPKGSEVWNRSTSEYVYSADRGTLLTMSWDGSTTLWVRSGRDGTLRMAVPFDENVDVFSARIETLDGSKDSALVFLTSIQGDDLSVAPTYQANLWSIPQNKSLTSFDLQPGLYLVVAGPGYVSTYSEGPSVGPAVGDWDADGLTDLGYHENNTAIVRSSRTGERLAVATPRSYIINTVDVDADGRQELVLGSRSSQLRLAIYDTKSQGLGDRPDLIRKVEKPLEPLVEEGAKEFFDEASEKGRGIPAPSAALFAVALTALLWRTRRKEG